MANRRDEKERLRREREEAERRAHSGARKRLILGYMVAGLLAAAVVVGVVFAIASGGGEGGGDGDGGPNVDNRTGATPPEVVNGDLAAAARAAGCELQLDLPDQGSDHVDPPTPDSLPKYDTNPPTSGDHYAAHGADGAFLTEPSPGNLLHSLEHGRVAIQYSPDLPEEDQLALKGVFDSDRGGMIMFPNASMPSEVAITAWTQLLSCKTFEGGATLDAVRAFRDQYRGRGPEAVPF